MHRFLSEPRIAAYEALLGREHVKQRIDTTLDEFRCHPEVSKDGRGIEAPPFDTLVAQVLEKLERSAFDLLVPVINGTGILLHTNLGRAPLAQPVLEA
ncbi:MAG TPA: hypothetical protein VIO32_08245, partial [Candidatus Baltobacteraceae bacterium]